MKSERRMNTPKKTILLLCCFASGTLLSGCMTGGAAFGLGAGAVHETETVEKDPNQPPPVYGPPQIIYRIDSDRYFTLENYVSCEKGETFYNNKKKDIHVKISPASGYLFKGRLYWVSSRDDYLAFPTTKNTEAAACMGSDKGCKNVITITTDGGKTLNATTYGIYSQDPTGITKDYDMLVTNSGFYIIDFSGESRSDDMASTWKWTFDPDEESTKKYGYPGATGPDSQDGLPMNDISKVKQVRMQCDKSLIPQQKLN